MESMKNRGQRTGMAAAGRTGKAKFTPSPFGGGGVEDRGYG